MGRSKGGNKKSKTPSGGVFRKGNPYIQSTKPYNESKTSAFWTQAEDIASDLVVSHKHLLDSPSAGPVRLTNLITQVAGGVIFLMDFQVVGENRKIQTYSADVWVKPALTGIVVRSLEKVIHPGNSKRPKKVITLYMKDPVTILDSSMFDVSDTAKIESLFGKNLCRLRTRGYYFVLNQIKDQWPRCTYREVRKMASAKWRQLSKRDKEKYMSYAARLLKDKEDAASSLMH